MTTSTHTYLNDDERGYGIHGSSGKNSLTSSQAASQKLDEGSRLGWSSPEATEISYSFRATATPNELAGYGVSGFQQFSSAQITAAEKALLRQKPLPRRSRRHTTLPIGRTACRTAMC